MTSNAPTIVQGTGIGLGVAIGVVARMSEPLPAPADTPSGRTQDEEGERARTSLGIVARELEARGQAAGGAARDVLEAQAMMAEDPMLSDAIDEALAAGKTAERAVFEAFATFRDQLAAMGGYLGERAADLDDVSQRVIADLGEVAAPGVPSPDHPFVLVARDLAPADTAMLDLDKVLGLVTSDGGPTSHTAILAREKSIVAIVGAADAGDLADGTLVIVDAAAGTVIAHPSDEQKADAERRIAERKAAAVAPVTPGALADGTAIPLLANLGSSAGAQAAADAGAEGVGLFRTEFLFLDARGAVRDSAIADPRVHVGVDEIDEQVRHHEEPADEEDRPLHQRVVALEHGPQEQPPHARQREHLLGDDGAAQQVAHLDAGHRDQRDEAVLERVSPQHALLGQRPWRARCGCSPGASPPAPTSASCA